MKLKYNFEDKSSIIQFAKKFIGKTVQSEFSEALSKLELSNNDKGQLGKVIEKLYFQYEPNSNSKADFESAGLELKSSGLKQLKNKEYRAKERLVLSIINFISLIDQNFNDDFLNGKNGHLLLIFYLYKKGLNQLDSEIKLVGDWKYPIEDLEIIRQDWLAIQYKVKEGRAHELSEGDTFYLGACTKGDKATTTRKQPNSGIPAKQRAFSLKPGYVNHIIASIAGETLGHYGKLIPSLAIVKKLTLEEIVISKFKSYYNKTAEQILIEIGLELNLKAKNFYANLTKAVLGIELNKEIEEFEKAEIVVKTVRLKQNNMPDQDISFPNFKYKEIVNEEWEDSNFKDILEHKFLFVFFQYENGILLLKKVRFWNMPYEDILEAEKVWERTKEIVSKGIIVKGFKTNKNGKISRMTNFPSKKFNSVSHVRPHTTNSSHTYPLPKSDRLTKENVYTKHCFWLNNSYIKNQIFLK
jgi:DNA mismatch repair protein MutH